MSLLLAADIGKRRTGLALGDTKAGFVVALETVKHLDETELIKQVVSISRARKVSEIYMGLPLLPQGSEGEQSTFVRKIAKKVGEQTGLPVTLLDERYSSQSAMGTDPDARAACEIASLAVQMRQK